MKKYYNHYIRNVFKLFLHYFYYIFFIIKLFLYNFVSFSLLSIFALLARIKFHKKLLN